MARTEAFVAPLPLAAFFEGVSVRGRTSEAAQNSLECAIIQCYIERSVSALPILQAEQDFGHLNALAFIFL